MLESFKMVVFNFEDFNWRTFYLQYRSYHGATNARLNNVEGPGKEGGWPTPNLEEEQWIQVDLGDVTKVKKIATQRRSDSSQWVIEYKVSYSFDGNNFEFYKNVSNSAERVS